MTTKPQPQHPVSRNNPCPFLRALVANGQLADDTESLAHVTSVIVDVARSGEGHPELPSAPIYAIAMAANGIGPLSLLRSQREGLRLNELRSGPLNKKGVGSTIIDALGHINAKELARLQEFASSKISTDVASLGESELGLNLKEITAFMNANFKRAAGRRRAIDRALMNGEWPVLLKVMGKNAVGGRYLSCAEVGTLFTERNLPQRMNRD
jgi:hypothetical protein